jgi:hypothetical protein
MKKTMYSLLAVSLFCISTYALADNSQQSAAGMELRPAQKAMQARSGWIKAMSTNLDEKKFEEVGKDAASLAAQTSAAGEKMDNPLAKELTLKLSSQAKAIVDAAAKKDSASITMKIAEIKATCGECHTKIRDKK